MTTDPYLSDEGYETYFIDPGTLDPLTPSWADVVGGIWYRLTNPLPPTT